MVRLWILAVLTVTLTASKEIFINISKDLASAPSIITVNNADTLVIDLTPLLSAGYNWQVLDDTLYSLDGKQILKKLSIKEVRGPTPTSMVSRSDVTRITLAPIVPKKTKGKRNAKVVTVVSQYLSLGFILARQWELDTCLNDDGTFNYALADSQGYDMTKVTLNVIVSGI